MVVQAGNYVFPNSNLAFISLASAPVAVEIFRDEVRHQRDAKEAARFGRYRVGDADLAAIKVS